MRWNDRRPAANRETLVEFLELKFLCGRDSAFHVVLLVQEEVFGPLRIGEW